MVVMATAVLGWANATLGQGLAQRVPVDPGRIPEQILRETTPVTPPTEPEGNASQRALANTARRYPWIVNPGDRLTFSPSEFNPEQGENYINLDLRFARQNPNFMKFTYGQFPGDAQLYWVLPGNRVVIETQGWQGGIVHRGEGQGITVQRRIEQRRALTGVQTVTTLPENFAELAGEGLSVNAMAARIENPPGIPAPAIALPARPSATPVTPAVGNTNSPTGGVVNFDQVAATNVPQVLQGFPTNNLQGLFEGVPLQPGQRVSEAALAAYGLTWGQPLPEITPLSEFTSLPGVKILQPEGFENQDFLKLLTDPTLSSLTKQRHYLNSLFWSAFEARAPEITDDIAAVSSVWQRVYVSRPLNQTLLVYGADAPTAEYTNRLVNIGLSAMVNLEAGQVDGSQSVNTLLGMLLGGVFLAVQPEPLRTGVQEARSQQETGAAFAPLTTQVSPDARRAINQRLNDSLFYSNLVSGLEQVSGRLAFSQSLAPNHSSLFQIRTGLHRRVLSLSQRDIPEPTPGPTEIAEARTAIDKFPLTFLGATVPANFPERLPENQSEAAQVVVTTPDGREFVQEMSSLTTVPVGIQRSILAFDRIELRRVDRQTASLADFRGYASLPSLEAAWNGSSNGFQYGVNSGLWFNTAPQGAGPVTANTQGMMEPGLGFFANALVNWQNVQVDREGDRITAVTTNVPILRLVWNSAATADNNNLVSLAHTFRRQVQGWEWALTPGAALVFDALASRGIAFLQGNLATLDGLEVNGSIESDREVFWRLEGTQRLSPEWAVGGYVQNFRDVVQGVDTRTVGSGYGLTVRYTLPQSRIGLESQVGIAEDSVEARFRGSLRF
ncbi:MAG TPA: hypothetical protein DCQ32_05215 [Cyanobacteria bacterium UBA8156]|nr:hypothetical protein [Cyanobacteria bacterium UBA8156]